MTTASKTGKSATRTNTTKDRTEELFARWAAEDATDDPALIEAAERDLIEFKKAINANRALDGGGPIYK